MSNIIDSIQLSGTVYTIQGTSGGGSPTVELTQAEYDALVTAGTVSADTYYIITDAQARDLTQYWTSAQTQSAITLATSGKVDSNVYTAYTAATDTALASKIDTSTYNTYTAATDTALASKQTTLTAGTNITIVDNVISATGGGGKAIEAGRGIKITTGETADTVSFNLPLSSSTLGSDSIVGGYFGNTSMAQYGFAYGDNAKCGNGGVASIALGRNVTANGNAAIALGSDNTAKGKSVAIGRYINTNIEGEIGVGIYNVSSSASTTFGDSGNTLFSVGNGTSSARHNAFEIRQNGDIYLSLNGQDVKLQDQLGGGGSSYSAGSGINIDSANTISAVYRGWAGERVQYLENISTPFYMFKADDCGYQSTFQVSFYINDIQTVVEFDVSTQTYAFIEGDSSWENYVAVEWDTTFGSFKATPNTSINVSDGSCARFSKFLFSGTTENAIDGTLDRIEYIKANGFGNNIEFAARDVENDLLIAPLTLNGVYPFQRSVSFSGGIKSIDGKISTQMQATPYKWISGVTMWSCETSEFAVPSSSVTFNMSRNPSDGLYIKDEYGNSYRIIDGSGNPDSTEYYTTVIDNGYVTVTTVYSNGKIKLLGDNSCELDQYVSDVQYWGYEVDTIPNVVLNINNTIGNINTILESI